MTVLSVLRQLRVPTRLQAIIGGESLFNDGIGIVLYTIFLHQRDERRGIRGLQRSACSSTSCARPAAGLCWVWSAGGLAFAAMRGIDEYNIELMISLALVTGTFGIAQTLGVSGPVAVVVAGLLMGSIGVRYAVSGTTHDYLQKFWTLVDELLNSFLFLLIGLEFAAIDLRWTFVVAAGLAIPLSLVVRGLSITIASLPLEPRRATQAPRRSPCSRGAACGAESPIALALSLPAEPLSRCPGDGLLWRRHLHYDCARIESRARRRHGSIQSKATQFRSQQIDSGSYPVGTD